MDHRAWFETATDNATVNAAAKTAGIVQRTLARQLARNQISAESVISIAEAYGLHPVGALVDTGFLNEKWATAIDPSHALRKVDEETLAYEVLRRMKIGAKTDVFTTPVDELSDRRERTSEMPLTAVAYNGPDEDAQRGDGE